MNEEDPFDDGSTGAGATSSHRHGDGGTTLRPRPPPSRRPRRQQQQQQLRLRLPASSAAPAPTTTTTTRGAASSSSSSSSPPWADAVAGAVAALVALLVTYPMDVHKTRTQASPSLKQDTGQGGAGTSEEMIAGDEDVDAGDDDDNVAAGRRRRRRRRLRLRLCLVDSVAHWYAGWQTKVLHTSASSFCYFYLYGYLLALYKNNRRRTRRRDGASEQTVSPSAHLLLSAVAAMLNTFVTLPLDVISSRQQVGCSPPPFSCDDKVALSALLPAGILSSSSSSPSSSLPRQISELWKGLVPSLILCVNPAIHYTVFDALKDMWLGSRQRKQRSASSVSGPPPPPQQLSVLEAFVMGVVAKFVATVVTYPLIRAKVLLMVGSHRSEEADGDRSHAEIAEEISLHSSSSGSELIRCLVDDYRTNGIRGWYAGCTLQLLHTLFKSALLMAVKEKIGSNASWAAWFAKK